MRRRWPRRRFWLGSMGRCRFRVTWCRFWSRSGMGRGCGLGVRLRRPRCRSRVSGSRLGCRLGSVFVRLWITRRRMLRRRRFIGGCWCAVVRWFRPRAGRDVRPAVIYGSKHHSVGASGTLVLCLFGSHGDMLLTGSRKLRRGGPSLNATWTAVEGDVVVAVGHVCGVGVTNDRGVHVCYGRIVEILVPPPPATIESGTRITETIINASVEAYRRAPVTSVPGIKAIGETPIAGCPKQTGFGWKHPNAWYPEVAVIPVSPVPWRPDVTGTRADRLSIDR
jgi:hypothetical protein